ncbi:MAG: sugar-transfer associated ATP-grasp domain-containing protein [Bacilli bacterium]|jgi:hypothetical protein
MKRSLNKIILYYNFKFLIKGFMKPHFKEIIETINEVSKETKRLRFIILFDMAWCRIIHITDYFEYQLYEMYKLNWQQRKTMFTEIHKWAYAKKYNDVNYRYIFNYKDEFNKEYAEFIGRKWLRIKEDSKKDIEMFIKNKEYIIGKNVFGGGGKQVFKINLKEYKNTEELLDFFFQKKINLIEECIVQHSKLNKMYPGSVNTLRIVTILKNNRVNILFAYLRVGNGNFVDNMSSGGMLAPIDLKSGIINKPAMDYKKNIFKSHPQTKTMFVGFKIPMWRECLDLVIKASKKSDKVCFVGWDVSLTKKGPVLIEGNYYPDSSLYQLPAHIPGKIGKLPEFKTIHKRR